MRWITRVAETGDAEAMDTVGIGYMSGIGVPKNYKKAIEWFTKAADKGNAHSMYSLGVCFHDGLGCEKDKAQALFWIKTAADAGEAHAKAVLPRLLEEADGKKNK